MNWLIAFHVISMVSWFAGLFYLPRLFVYHSMTDGPVLIAQYKIMEHRLYYYITMPAAIATLIFGLAIWLPRYGYYAPMMWLHIKLILVLFLYGYHFYLGYLLKQFKKDRNMHSHQFYRILNEIPTVFLIVIVILAVVKP